jgi:alpha-N-acetylglucosaminidase
VVARYGKYDPDIYNAWQLLLQSAYISHTNELTGAYESIFCARPDTGFITSASTWGCKKLPYNTAIFFSAARCFAKAATRFASSDTYRYDLTDIWRQVIALKARQPYAAFMKAFKEQNVAEFKRNKAQFIALLTLQNRWTATHAGFCLRTWLQQAENMLPDEKDKALAVWNAKVQITYWGHSSNPATLGHDYANKEWSGLLKDYYLPRWKAFFDYAEMRMQGLPAQWPDFFGMEKAWTEQRNSYAGDTVEDGVVILPEVIQAVFGL